ncbi:MAG: Uma2 family endonuclease [Cyanobacteria bacterium J06648_11]
MLQLDRTSLPHPFPNTDTLPGSDNTPVDNEDQNFVPNVLLFVLEYLWRTREDWHFGVDMALYYLPDTGTARAIVPDGFLSVGVKRPMTDETRKSYFIWKEKVTPQFVLEHVSETKGGEYDDKLAIYQKLGVKYYAIFNPKFSQRDRHELLEIYRLEGDRYVLQPPEEPYWMPEIGLGLGRCTQTCDLRDREVLCWFDEKGDRYLTQDERGEAEKQRADAEQERAERAEKNEQLARQQAAEADQRAEVLAAKLRELGIEPASFSADG